VCIGYKKGNLEFECFYKDAYKLICLARETNTYKAVLDTNTWPFIINLKALVTDFWPPKDSYINNMQLFYKYQEIAGVRLDHEQWDEFIKLTEKHWLNKE
jgi:hypothetical protein